MGFLRTMFFSFMSKALAEAETTNVVGYFNPNTWPIHVAISDLNIALQLKPKEYVLNRSGQKINDPLLQKYVGNKMLACETSTDPVALIRIPGRTGTPDHQASVQTGFRDSTGKWQPPLPKNQDAPISQAVVLAPAEPVSPHNPVRGMTIDQARKAGLVAPTRKVPEDYGADETTGVPIEGGKIPPIKLATDLVKKQKPAPLPEELTRTDDPNKIALKAQLDRARTFNPEKPPLLTGTIQEAVQAAGGPELTNVIDDVQLPPPNLEEAPPASPQPVVSKVIIDPAKRFVCKIDGKGFKFRSELQRYAVRKHAAQVDEIMADYPK